MMKMDARLSSVVTFDDLRREHYSGIYEDVKLAAICFSWSMEKSS